MTDITITISDRDAKALKSFVKANSLDMTAYIWEAVSERFNKDRYGDMNDMVKKPEKKKAAPKKTKPKEEPAKEVPMEIEQPQENTVTAIVQTETEQEPKKRTTRRVLKVKK